MASEKSIDLAQVRRSYEKGSLHREQLHNDPFDQFAQWYRDAEAACRFFPNNVVVSTLDEKLQPHSRTVLLKGLDQRGFVFYTNYQSRKAAHLGAHPRAAMTFFWEELERQVNVVGQVEKVTEAESDAYFATRPRGSQIGAWVSNQSHVIGSRDELHQRQAELEQQFADKPVTRPPHWGGYRLLPVSIEFWQGQSDRLHDRFEYQLQADASWTVQRLSP